jgi:magnesium transporter
VTAGAAVRRQLASTFLQRHPAEAAAVLETLPSGEIAAVVERDAAGAAGAAFERLTLETAEEVLERLSDDATRRTLTSLDASRAATVLARLDPPRRERLLALLPDATARELRSLLDYPPDSAGSLMDPRVAVFRPETTVSEAIARLRRAAGRELRHVYLVDDGGRLIGSVSLHRLVAAAADEPLGRLARGAPWSVEAATPREELVDEFRRRNASAVPVVNLDGVLLGVIRQGAMMQAIEEETTADIQTMVGASAQERALSRVSFAVRKRLPWLEINLLTAFLAAAVVGLFESTIARFTALAVLLPVVAGQSGNTGAQALAVTMRGLAMREIRLRHWLPVALKEVQVAAINGVGVALTTALGVFVWSRSTGLALVIGISMILSMIAAGLSGALIPMLLTAAGQDPAQSSSIILTTVTDIAGFFSFLGIATLLAGML